jgi:hypothetical protein
MTACNNHDQKPKELEYLVGTWVLDSATSFRQNKYQKEGAKYLTFYSDSNYTFKIYGECIHLDFKGKYFILNNPKRGLKTITLVPDTVISESDTIRLSYDNFDIVNLTNKRLQIVRETEFINTDDINMRFNKSEIYKKIK